MSTLDELARLRTRLGGADLVHLERLAAGWRVLADLSFADLVLLAPIAGEEGHRFVVLAQVRPVTGQTSYPQDLVGTVVDEVERPLLARCWRAGESVEADTHAIGAKERVRVQCIPVRRGGRLIALLTRESSSTFARRTGELERTYLETFQRFAQMIADGSFPFDLDEIEIESAPRVGDGVILIDGEMRVKFASPNAVSLLHRLGIHTYAQRAYLADIGFDDDAARDAMRRHLPVATEIERDDVSMFLRVLPLFEDDEPTGALLLMRDVSDLRRRDRMLLSKDATIREIHHRVKNNLQTIAALLRLQARRLHSPEARAALVESERRIRSIAIVHETLSRDAGDVIRFNEIVRPLARLVEDTSSTPDHHISFVVDGDAGELPGEVATPLAVVLNELMQNAVDHAFAEGDSEGKVHVLLGRDADHVTMEVRDTGAGLPDRFSLEESRGLGLTIVQALVTGELGGFGALAQAPALFFGEAAPYAGFLVGAERELETLRGHRTLSAHTTGGVDLVERATRSANRKEQFRSGVATSSAVTPLLRVPVVRPDPGQRHDLSPFEGRIDGEGDRVLCARAQALRSR
jgi:two-component sensor histidine kinase